MLKSNFLSLFITFVCVSILLTCTSQEQKPQTVAKVEHSKISLIPSPREVSLKNRRIPVITGNSGVYLILPKEESKSIQFGVKHFNHTIKELCGQEATLISTDDSAKNHSEWTRIITGMVEQYPEQDLFQKERKAEGYIIQMIERKGRWDIYALGCDERGAFYALLTLSQLLVKEGNDVSLVQADIKDWPSYALRDFNRDGGDAMPDARPLAEWAVRYKVNTVGISHFWPWRKVPDEFWKSARETCQFAKESGVFDVMFYCNPYSGKQINLLDKSDMDLFLNHIRTALAMGATKVMVCVDDFTVWNKFTKEEQARFEDLATAQAYLMNYVYKRIRRDYPNVEFFFCPAGPWGGYAGVPLQGSEQEHTLQVLAKEIPRDVSIVWTGPEVRSRKIKVDQLERWSQAAGGRKPFLWDNTIYAHYQSTFVDTFLNPYKNKLPDDMPSRLSRGIHINGAGGGSEKKNISLLTAADYLWNAETYDPDKSLNKAMDIVAGAGTAPLLLQFRGQAVAAIKDWKAKKPTAVEKRDTALKTLEQFTAITSNKKLAQELRAFLDSNTK